MNDRTIELGRRLARLRRRRDLVTWPVTPGVPGFTARQLPPEWSAVTETLTAAEEAIAAGDLPHAELKLAEAQRFLRRVETTPRQG